MKKKRTMKIVSLILAIVMAISIMPLAALADENSKQLKMQQNPHGTASTIVYNYMLSNMIEAKSFSALTKDLKESVQNILSGKIALPDVKVTLIDDDGDEWEMTKSEHSQISNLVTITSKNDVIQGLLDSADGFFDFFSGKLLEGLDLLSADAATKLMNLVYVGYEAEVPVGHYTAKVEYIDRDGYVVNKFTKEAYNGKGGFDVVVSKNKNTVFGARKNLNGEAKDLVDTVAQWCVQNVKLDGSWGFVSKIVNGGLELLTGATAATFKGLIGLIPVEIDFYGIWTDFDYPEFSFTNVDFSGTGVAGTSFLMINRDELIGVMHWLEDMGEVTVNNTLDAMNNMLESEDTASFKDLMATITSVIQVDNTKEEGIPLKIDWNSAKDLIVALTKLAFASSSETISGTTDAIKVIYNSYKDNDVVIPAILMATSNDNGLVTFSPEKNITLVWELEVFDKLMDALVPENENAEERKTQAKSILSKIIDETSANILVEAYFTVMPNIKAAAGAINDTLVKLINDYAYYAIEGLGFVGDKMYSGNYIMFNSGAAENFLLNPLAYTVEITWDRKNPDAGYAKVADLGIVAPYFASDFYTFVRNTSGVKVADSYINLLLGGKVDLIEKTLNDSIDLTAEMIGFMTLLTQNMLGGDMIAKNENALAKDMAKFIYANGRSMQKLLMFANQVAMKSKAVYTGSLDENWYYYSMKKNIFENVKDKYTAINSQVKASLVDPKTVTEEAIHNTGNLKKSTDQETYKPGSTIKAATTAVSTAVKNVTKAVTTAVPRIVTTVKKTVTLFGNVLKSVFTSKTNNGMITFNA